MAYTQNPTKYDAVQWTEGGDPEAFSAVVDPTADGVWTVNEDGSLHLDYFGSTLDFPIGVWVVSLPYWTVAAWRALSWTMTTDGTFFFDPGQFDTQFTEI